MAFHDNVSPELKSFTSSVQHKFTFSALTTPNIEDLLKEYEKSMIDELLPNIKTNPV